jgi:hypothetical protein
MKILNILFASLLITLHVSAAETLSFRLANPHIEYFAPDNYLVYEVQMKCTANGTYLYSSQVIFNVNAANFNTAVPPSFVPGFIAGTFFKPPVGPTYDKYTVTTNWNSGNLNIAIVHTVQIDAYYPASYSEVTTSWQTLGTVYAVANSNALTGVSGISFQTQAMNGYQKYATGPSASAYYNSPNLYFGNDLASLYMGRIFSGTPGWTQWGGTLDWAIAVNTSVWDTVSAAATISNTASKALALRIHPAARLKILAAKDLTCTGNTEINEPKGLVIGADATGPGQFIDNGTIQYNTGGSVRAESFYNQNQWHMYCIPVASTTAVPYLGMYMEYYLEPSHRWKFVVNPDSVLNTVMNGYAMWADQTNPPLGNHLVAPSGTLNTGSLTPITVTRNDGTDGYNLLGNPYPSAIDLASSGISWGPDIDQKAWFWNATGGNYYVYIKAGGSTHSQYAPPQQGFFVHHATTNTTPTTFTMNNTARTTTLTEPFWKQALDISDLLYLNAKSLADGSADMNSVLFNPDATAGYDDLYDAGKMWGSNSSPQLYSMIAGNMNLTVNALPWTGVNQDVPLGFKCGVSGNFSITASNTESFNSRTSIFLEDLSTHTSQDLRTEPLYNFSYVAGENENRFVLHFTNLTFGIEHSLVQNFQVYSSKEDIYIKSSEGNLPDGMVRVYDAVGKEIFASPLDHSLVNKFTLSVSEGYYLVKLITEKEVITRKIYLE